MLLSLLGGLLYLVLSAHTVGPAAVANLECTGVSGPGGCGGSSCHGTTPSTQITDTILVMNDSGDVVNYYVPGDIYTLRIRGFNNSTSILPKFGFQLTAIKYGTTTSAGFFIGTPNIHNVYVTPSLLVSEHSHTLWCSGSGGYGSFYQVDVQWVAPSGAGTIALNAVVNAVDTNGTAGPEDHWAAPGAPVLLTEGHPPVIFGPNHICAGATSPISMTPAGGTFSSSDPSIATVTLGGNITGINAGTINLTYTAATGATSIVFTVNPLPAAISGNDMVCLGGSAALTDSTPGGTFFSSNSSVAPVTTSGMVSGVTTGTANITYKVTSTGCQIKKTVTVSTPPIVAISGASVVCTGYTVTLSGSPAGGTWSSTNSAKVTVDASGVVTGVTSGSATIKYKVTTYCGIDSTTTGMAIKSTAPCVTGVDLPFAQANEIRVFPNPNNGSFSLNVLSTADEEARIVVTNIVGSRVGEYNIKTNEENNIAINQPAGTYFLSATTLGNKYFVKVVVQ